MSGWGFDDRLRSSAGHVHHHDHDAHGDAHGHSHGLVDRSIVRSREGVKAVAISLGILGVAGIAQLAIFFLSSSVALFADLVHNFGDALTAIPLGIAFGLRSFRAEKIAGLAVVLAIFVSACVALYETIQRFIHPEDLTHLWALAAAGLIGFVGNELAAHVRLRAGTPTLEPSSRRGRQSRAHRRIRLARRRRERGARRRRAPASRSCRGPGDHARDLQDHLGFVAG
jgi:hypothetical protein